MSRRFVFQIEQDIYKRAREKYGEDDFAIARMDSLIGPTSYRIVLLRSGAIVAEAEADRPRVALEKLEEALA